MKMSLAAAVVFLFLSACQSAAPFANMTVVPVGTKECKALCLIHGDCSEGDSIWFVDGENELRRTRFVPGFSGLNWAIPSPDRTRFALMSSCEGCFELEILRVSDGLSPRRNAEDQAKPICSIYEHRYHPVDVRWSGNHELRFSAPWNFPDPPEDMSEDLPLRHWKWDIESGKIEEVKGDLDESRILAAAKAAVAANDAWGDQADFEKPERQPDGSWRVVVWRRPATPGGFRFVVVGSDGEVKEYIRGH